MNSTVFLRRNACPNESPQSNGLDSACTDASSAKWDKERTFLDSKRPTERGSGMVMDRGDGSGAEKVKRGDGATEAGCDEE